MSILALVIYVFIFIFERGNSEFIIYSTEDGIYRYGLGEGGPRTKLNHLQNSFTDIEFESNYNCIIFENDNEKSLQRLCLSGENNTVETITNYTGYVWVTAIAYDWVGENIFWITWYPFQILVARRDGSNQRLLFNSTHVDIPNDLALDPHRGWMYWTDTSNANPRIVRAQMDGNQSTYQVLVQNNVLKPWFLTLDQQFENIYWTDNYLTLVMKASVTGENLEKIATADDISYPLAIDMYRTILCWTDSEKNGILYKDMRPDRCGIHMLVGNISRIFDLKVLSGQTQTLPPIDVGFSVWSTWSSCSKTCGSGTKTRTRTCNNPLPPSEGTACCCDSLQEFVCNTQVCPDKMKDNGIIIGIAIGAGSCIAVFILITFAFCVAKKRKSPVICCSTVHQENEHQYEDATFSSENEHVYMEVARPQSKL